MGRYPFIALPYCRQPVPDTTQNECSNVEIIVFIHSQPRWATQDYETNLGLNTGLPWDLFDWKSNRHNGCFTDMQNESKTFVSDGSNWINPRRKQQRKQANPRQMRGVYQLWTPTSISHSMPSALAGSLACQKFQGLGSWSYPVLMWGVFTFKQWLPSLTGFKNRQIF